MTKDRGAPEKKVRKTIYTTRNMQRYLFDFVWVSIVQAFVVVVFSLGPLFFIVEEVLLFAVLIIIKHRFPPPWQHDHRK